VRTIDLLQWGLWVRPNCSQWWNAKKRLKLPYNVFPAYYLWTNGYSIPKGKEPYYIEPIARCLGRPSERHWYEFSDREINKA
jgi:hypothetical protein